MQLRELTEGLKIAKDESGRRVIDYADDDKPDAPFFKALTRSAGVDRSAINLHKDDYSTEEISALKQHIAPNPKAYQEKMPLYTAMPLHMVGAKTDDFLDALKRRNEDEITFTEHGLDALMQKGADSVISALAKDRNNFKMFDRIVVAPIPSGKSLVYDFTKKVVASLEKFGKPVSVANDLLSKAASPKYGTIIRGAKLDREEKRPDKFFSRKKAFRKEAYDRMFKLFKDGQMTEDDLFGFYEQRLGQIEARENQLATRERTEKVNYEIEALQQEKDYLEQFLEKITDPSYQQGEQLSPEEIKTVRGLLRRLSYDRFEVTSPGTIQANNKSRTLVILVDDNVDTKRSLIDAYRVLFKNAEVQLPNSFVVAVALHQLKQPSTVK